jgi:hypothetical protein
VDALADDFGTLLVGFGKQGEELVATVPDHVVGAAHAGLQNRGDLGEYVISHQVAMAIVHVFEVIYVTHQERQRTVGALGAGDLSLQEVREQTSREDVRQRIDHAGGLILLGREELLQIGQPKTSDLQVLPDVYQRHYHRGDHDYKKDLRGETDMQDVALPEGTGGKKR